MARDAALTYRQGRVERNPIARRNTGLGREVCPRLNRSCRFNGIPRALACSTAPPSLSATSYRLMLACCAILASGSCRQSIIDCVQRLGWRQGRGCLAGHEKQPPHMLRRNPGGTRSVRDQRLPCDHATFREVSQFRAGNGADFLSGRLVEPL